MPHLRARQQPDVRARIADEVGDYRGVLGQRGLHGRARLRKGEIIRGLHHVAGQQPRVELGLHFVDVAAGFEQVRLCVVAAARAALQVHLQRGHGLAQVFGLRIGLQARAELAVRQAIGERTRADGLGGAERAPDGRRIARRGRQLDFDARLVRRVTRGQEARAHLRIRRFHADPRFQRHGRIRGLRRRLPRSPLSSSARASAELESMRSKSSRRRA